VDDDGVGHGDFNVDVATKAEVAPRFDQQARMVGLMRRVADETFAHGHGPVQVLAALGHAVVAEIARARAESAFDKEAVIAAVGVMAKGAVRLEGTMHDGLVGLCVVTGLAETRPDLGGTKLMAILDRDVTGLALVEVQWPMEERCLGQIAVAVGGDA
jgi:hypothetical protein